MHKGSKNWRVLSAVFLLLASAWAAPLRAQAPMAFSGQRAFADIQRLVAFGPRPPGSKALAASRRWIIHQLLLDGCKVERDRFTASTPVGAIKMTNIIAKIPGAKPSVIMLAGHYDTKLFTNFRFVGANDGGSSAAFLLEMARLLGRRKNPYTIWLVFFDGEEALKSWSNTDSLYGSRHLVNKLTADGELSRIQAMILVDMVADANLDIRRDVNSTRWLSDLLFQTADRLGYSRSFLKNQLTAIEDDHVPFVNAGVPAVDVIDLDYGPNNSYHHTAQDTLDKCSPQSLQIVGNVVTAMLGALEHSLRLH
ncbi:MAG TPA: M28 family peptidase [Terriglobia bacterium]|nr:M28 family peptidase [Terriglobia bacterium]